ncbi:MAG: glycoside hydrolase family 16 protein [Candidatus Acidiferrum sp.]
MRVTKTSWHLKLGLVAAILFACVGPRQGAAQNWGTPVWSDEFTGQLGTPIDATKWRFETGILNVNNEVEYYCSPGMTSSGCNSTQANAYIDGNDHLVIQAIKINASTAPNSGSWTSARMTTNGTKQFQYGRVEARMMLPSGAGLWPAFWALGISNGCSWPACGEEDYMENVPASAGLGPTKISSTLHGPGYYGANGLHAVYTFPSGDVAGYHTYGAIWSPNMVQFYVDDPANVFFVRTASDVPAGQQWVFNRPFYLLLNLAVGGVGSWPGPPDATTPTPAVMTVDYVRIYQTAAVTAPNFGTPPSITVKAGSISGNSSTFSVGDAAGSGRMYLSCTTNAPRASCQVKTNDALNPYTLDFTSSSTGTVSVSLTTSANGAALASRWGLRNVGSVTAILSVCAIFYFLYRLRGRMLRPVPVLGMGLLLLMVANLPGCNGGSSTVPPPSGGTAPGSYAITVNAYTISGNGNQPDTTVSIPVTVN